MFVFRVQQTAMVCEHTMEQQLLLVQSVPSGFYTWHLVNAPAPNTKQVKILISETESAWAAMVREYILDQRKMAGANLAVSQQEYAYW